MIAEIGRFSKGSGPRLDQTTHSVGFRLEDGQVAIDLRPRKRSRHISLLAFVVIAFREENALSADVVRTEALAAGREEAADLASRTGWSPSARVPERALGTRSCGSGGCAEVPSGR